MKNYLTTIEFKWAAIFIIAQFAWMAMEKAIGWHEIPGIADHPKYTMLFGLVAVIVYVFALLDKRKNGFGGSMTWKQGFFTGLSITLILTILTPLIQYVIHTVITPDYFANAADYSVDVMEMDRAKMQEYFKLKNYIVQSIIFALISGLLTSAIVAIFVKRK